ncbi:MAG: ABC transporter permease subunit, partial [Fusobacteriaceae bacterium]|nr:ABC transporter permease subunit [Fusobacteriaceae bacterium]
KNFKILYSVKAILIANVFYNSPIFVKYIGDGLGKIPRDLIESATIDGVSGIKRFFTIDIPLVLPQILRGGLLIFTYCFLSFGIVMSLGGIRFTTLEVKIVSAFMGGSKFSYGIFYGFVQLLILGFINIPRLMVTEISLSNDRKIGKTNFFFKLFSLIYLILEYGIVLSSFVFSFFNYYIGKFSLKYYKLIFSSEFNGEYPVITSIINSIKISFVVGLIVIFFSYLLIKNYNKFTEILMFSYIGVSGGFLGIALYYLNISFNIPIYVIVIVGQIITAIPIGYSFMYQHIKKFPKELLENAEIDCNNKLEKFIYVEFPNLKNIFLSAFLQVFAIIFGEFTLVYTMQIEDILPLSSLVNYSMVANKKYLESAAFTTIIIMIIGILFIIGEFLKKKEE